MTKKSKSNIDDARYRLMIENTNDLVATLDLQGNFTYVSPSHERVLGYKPDEMIGKSSFSFIHPKDQKVSYEEFRNVLEGKTPGLSMFRARHKDGSWRYLEATAASVFTRNNRPYMFVSITRDITSRVMFEHKKDEFINIVSHELRTPMTTIHIFSSLLEKKLQNEEKSLYMYSFKLKQQTENLTRLIEELVDMSEIQLGSLRLKKKDIFLATLIKELIAFYEPKIKHVVIVQADETIRVHADKKRIEDVLNALFSNAVKYSSPKDPIKIDLYRHNEQAEVAIADFGIGIAHSEQKKIFEKFYQVGDQTKFLRPGFGIGLFFAREIITMHKGHLWVRSEPGKGSTFYFSLPLIL